MVDSLAAMAVLMEEFAAAQNPVEAIDAAFDDAVAELVKKVRRFDAIRLIEVARLAFLPMAPEGAVAATAEASAAQVELLALIALAAQREATAADPTDSSPVEDQEMSHFVSEAKEELVALLRLAQMRSLAAVDPADKLAKVSLLIQGAEAWMRSSSYPERVEVTNPNVRAALNAELGFDATDALAVLNACHKLREVSMNDRMDALRTADTERTSTRPTASRPCVQRVGRRPTPMTKRAT